MSFAELMNDVGTTYPGEWRPVVGWERTHMVSDRGDVWSLPTDVRGQCRRRKNGPLKHSLDKYGYHEVCLHDSKRQKRGMVHQLVAYAFLGPRPAGQVVRHKDDNKDNNCVSNLEYGTDSDNKQDALRNGRNANAAKTHCKRGHPLSGENVWIEKTGARHCKQCAKERRYRARVQSV